YEFLERPGVRGRAYIATLLAAIAEAESGDTPDPLAEECRRAVGERLDALLPYLSTATPGFGRPSRPPRGGSRGGPAGWCRCPAPPSPTSSQWRRGAACSTPSAA